MSILTNSEIIKNHLTSAYNATKIIEMEVRILQEAIQRVRELHYGVIDTGGIHCEECSDTEFGHYIEYPCPTIQALEGEP